jgi:hypothetical protein
MGTPGDGSKSIWAQRNSVEEAVPLATIDAMDMGDKSLDNPESTFSGCSSGPKRC